MKRKKKVGMLNFYFKILRALILCGRCVKSLKCVAFALKMLTSLKHELEKNIRAYGAEDESSGDMTLKSRGQEIAIT